MKLLIWVRSTCEKASAAVSRGVCYSEGVGFLLLLIGSEADKFFFMRKFACSRTLKNNDRCCV